MKITKAGHYVVKVRGAAGVQYAHMELPLDFETDSHAMIEGISSGPEEDAETAWKMHHPKEVRL